MHGGSVGQDILSALSFALTSALLNPAYCLHRSLASARTLHCCLFSWINQAMSWAPTTCPATSPSVSVPVSSWGTSFHPLLSNSLQSFLPHHFPMQLEFKRALLGTRDGVPVGHESCTQGASALVETKDLPALPCFFFF